MTAAEGIPIPFAELAGHRALVYAAPDEPGLTRLPSGIFLASLGTSSDEPESELEEVLRQVRSAVGELSDPLPVRLIDSNGPVALSAHCGPEMPKIFEVPCQFAMGLPGR